MSMFNHSIRQLHLNNLIDGEWFRKRSSRAGRLDHLQQLQATEGRRATRSQSAQIIQTEVYQATLPICHWQWRRQKKVHDLLDVRWKPRNVLLLLYFSSQWELRALRAGYLCLPQIFKAHQLHLCLPQHPGHLSLRCVLRSRNPEQLQPNLELHCLFLLNFLRSLLFPIQ